MNFAEIVRDLETAPAIPEAALREARAHADELTPRVLELIDKLRADVYLLPTQIRLLVYGVHILAAARTAALWPAWCELLRLPAERLVDLFDDHILDILTSVTVSLVDDDTRTIPAMLEDTEVSGDVRWALFPVLARLTWEGRAALADTKALLARFVEEELADPDDAAWEGWLDAVVLLGLVELGPQIEEVLAKPQFEHFRAVDRTEMLKRLAAAAANFADESRFAEDHVEPFDDPLEGLWWLRMQEAAEENWRAELAEEEEDEADEGLRSLAEDALSPDELHWLDGFLDSDQVPPDTMPLEMLDGFFCAVAVGPPIPPAEAMPRVWGDQAMVFDSPAQDEFVVDLLERYRKTIFTRIAVGFGHEPFLLEADEDDRGRDWAAGFMRGMAFREEAWVPLVRNKRTGLLIASIVGLDDPGEYTKPIPPDVRSDILDALPDIVLKIAAAFRHRAQTAPQRRKIGRNEPCPCGSGRKYKKCCGANPPPVRP
jgi:uncharacterized protein